MKAVALTTATRRSKVSEKVLSRLAMATMRFKAQSEGKGEIKEGKDLGAFGIRLSSTNFEVEPCIISEQRLIGTEYLVALLDLHSTSHE